MFNVNYFKSDLIQQAEQLGSSDFSLAVHLTNGTVYRVCEYSPEMAKDGYVMLVVFPEEGVTEKSKADRRKVGGTDEVFFDRVAIPYECVTLVVLTLASGADRASETTRIEGFAAKSCE